MKTKAFYTAISTHDAEKTLDFYVNILGFHIAHKLNLPLGEITVIENDAGARIDIMAVDGEAGFQAFRTNVDDLEAAEAELKEKGYEVMGPAQITTGKTILVRDPNGLMINITQHFKK